MRRWRIAGERLPTAPDLPQHRRVSFGERPEQASGIDQVNQALTEMDELTQQNSALVEQSAATAKSLAQQAAAMRERVDVFGLSESERRAQTRRFKSAAA